MRTYELTPVLETLLDAHELDAFVSMEDKGFNVTYKNELSAENSCA